MENAARRRLDAVLFAASAAAFVVLRIPLYTQPGLQLGWNSDSALFGIIAREMVRESKVLWFFPGQDYLGTLTSMFAVAVGLLMNDVGPLALRLAVAFELILGLFFFWDALRRTWGRGAAHLVVFWLVAGPSWFFKLSYAPNAEQMFLVGAAITWFVASRRFETLWQWAILGILGGLGWWAHRGAVLVLPAAVMTVVWFDGWRGWRRVTNAALAFGAGIALGCLPLLAGRLQIDQPLYRPVTAVWSLDRAAQRLVETLMNDFWTFLGAREHRFGVLLAVVMVSLAAAGASRLRRERNSVFLIISLATSLGFWIFSTNAYSGATRYLALALPIVLGLAARGVVLLWSWTPAARVVAVAAVLLVAVSYYGGRILETNRIAAGKGEQHEQWPGGFDPRPALRQLRDGDYRACYADFWIAYKLEWLSGVPFIPYRSVDRTQMRSIRLAALPGPKCRVGMDGTVSRLSAPEEAALRAETVAHHLRRARSESR